MIADPSLMIFSDILPSDGSQHTLALACSSWTTCLEGLPSITSTAERLFLKKLWNLRRGLSSIIQVCIVNIVLVCTTTKLLPGFPSMGPSSMLIGGGSTGTSLAQSGIDFDWDDPSFDMLTPKEMGLPPDGSCIDHRTTAPPLPPESVTQPLSLSEANPDSLGNVPVKNSHEVTWAGCNATHPVIKPHTPPHTLTSEAAKNSHKITKEQKKNVDEDLQKAVKELIMEQNDVQPKQVQMLVVGETHYWPNQKVQLHNALVSTKAQEVNVSKCQDQFSQSEADTNGDVRLTGKHVGCGE